MPKSKPFSITFDETTDVTITAGAMKTLSYTITGAIEKTVVKALAQNNWRSTVNPVDHASGTITLTAPNPLVEDEIIVLVYDGDSKTIMSSINFITGTITVASEAFSLSHEASIASVNVDANIDYEVSIPEEAQDWLSVASLKSASTMRQETITFDVNRSGFLIKLTNKRYLLPAKLEKWSGAFIPGPGKILVVKKHQYQIVSGYTISGDAPKDFIRLYEYGAACKSKPNKWPLYIAKTGHKWYPTESITELLLNELGLSFGIDMAESKIAWIGGQLRFLSRYFLQSKEQELIHGADIFAGYVNDKNLIEEIEEQKLARDLLTLPFTKNALQHSFPYNMNKY